MKDIFLAIFYTIVAIGLFFAIPVFGVIVGTVLAILFIKHVITEELEDDE